MSDMRLDFPITVGNTAPLIAIAPALDKIDSSGVRASASVDKLSAGMGRLSGAAKTTTSDVYAVSGALSVMEGRMNARAVEQFTVRVLGLGSAFQTLFPLMGAIATFEVFTQMGEHAYKAFVAITEGTAKAKAGFGEIVSQIRLQNDSLAVSNDKLEETIAKLRNKPYNGMKLAIDESIESADRLSESLSRSLSKIYQGLSEQNISRFGGFITGRASTSDIEEKIGGNSGFSGAIGRANDLRFDTQRALAGIKDPKQAKAILDSAMAQERGILGPIKSFLQQEYDKTKPLTQLPSGVNPLFQSLADYNASKAKAEEGRKGALQFGIEGIEQTERASSELYRQFNLKPEEVTAKANSEAAQRAESIRLFHAEQARKASDAGEAANAREMEDKYGPSYRIFATLNKQLGGLGEAHLRLPGGGEERLGGGERALLGAQYTMAAQREFDADRNKAAAGMKLEDLKSYGKRTEYYWKTGIFEPIHRQLEDSTAASEEDIRKYDVGYQQRRSAITGNASHQGRIASLMFDNDPNKATVVAYQQQIQLSKQLADEDQKRVVILRTAADAALTDAERRKLLAEATTQEAKTQADIESSSRKAAQEFQVKQLEIQKKAQDEWRNTVVGGFEAAVSGGGTGLANYARSQGMKIAGTVVGNIADTQYRKGFFNIPGLNANSGIGQMFKHTPLVGGSDDPSMKLGSAADRQMTAADALVRAAQEVKAAASFFSQGGKGSMGMDIGGAPALSIPAPILSSGSVGAVMGSNAFSDGSYLPESGRSDPMASLNAAMGGNQGRSWMTRAAITKDFLSSLVVGKGGGGTQIASSAMSAIKSSVGVANALGADTSAFSDALGYSMIAGAGVLSMVNAFQHNQGSVRGDLQAAGGAASAISGVSKALLTVDRISNFPGLETVLSFLGPVGAAIGPILSIASMLFGDPKAIRQKHINKILATAQFYTPVSLDVTAGFAGGGAIRYNAQGQIQSTDLSPYPTIENPYLDYRHGVYVPGRVLVDFGGSGPGMGPGVGSNSTTSAMPSAAPTATTPLTLQNLNEFHQEITATVTKGIYQGGSGTDHITALRQALGI
jgi:hypothetical protein